MPFVERLMLHLSVRISLVVFSLMVVLVIVCSLVFGQRFRIIDWLVGVVLLSLLAFPLVRWMVNRTLAPLWRVVSAAMTLLEQWGVCLDKEDDGQELRENLLRVGSESQRRLKILETERAKIGAILDSMIEGVIALDRQGLVMLMNPSARRILDLGDEPVEGQSVLEVIRHRGLAELVELCHMLEPNQQCRREIDMQLPVHRILEVNAMPLSASQGIVLVLHDISELRRLEGVRAEFVANVSHELRTPLTAIKGYLETLLDETPGESQTHRRFLEVAYAHADRLGRLINDLLNLSDIETGKVVLHARSVALKEVVNDVLAIFEKEASRKGIGLRNEIPTDAVVWADRDRLSQIFLNLVENALKYTSMGGTCTFSAGERRPGVVGVQVIDTGQGIPEADLPRITERFYRVDKARSREMGGTGLGLAIVKHLVQLHGGTLRIESELGKGTTIDIELPTEKFVPTS